jgi:hypothetical protein
VENGGLQRRVAIPSLAAMKFLTTLKTHGVSLLISLVFLGVSAPVRASEFEGVDGPNVRYMRHEDGSRSVFIRSPDNKTLTKKTFSPNGVLTMLTTYKMDANQNPLGCKIRDGLGTEMFKVSYGYHRVTGQLVEELMFDSRVKRVSPEHPDKEMPVQRIVYVYDAEGKRSPPIVFNLLPGKTFEQVFGVKSSALDSNPFQEGGSSIKSGTR